MSRFRVSIVAAVILTTLLMASTASAVTLYVTGSAGARGVGYARLGMADNTAAKKIGIGYANYYLDRDYQSRQVWVWRFGIRMPNGLYPVRMYANNNLYDTVFQFTVNSSAHKTSKGIGVGSTASSVKSAYPGVIRYSGSINTILRLRYGTGRPYTDFVVKNSTGRVVRIDIIR